MKEYRVRITEAELEHVRSVLLRDMPNEGAAFLLAGLSRCDISTELIVRRLVEIPRSEYRIKNEYHLDISPRAINGIISLCEKNGLGLILCHSHSMGTTYSESDDLGEARIAHTLWQFLPDIPVGSLLFTEGSMRGRVWQEDGAVKPIKAVSVIGRHLKRIKLEEEDAISSHYDNQIYDRQVLAFGQKGQEIIEGTKVGIIGLGGTGSPTAEQLVRLGIKDLVLVDKDIFEKSNLSRVYGSTYSDTLPNWFSPSNWFKKKTKADLLKKHLKRINPKINITSISGNVVNNDVCKVLFGRDIIFSCTDEHWGRSILNQLAYQYLIPVINMGVRIDSQDGQIRGASGSIHVLQPGKPCLWCYGFLNGSRVYSESLPPSERDKLLRESYVEDVSSPVPSVVSLTTTISGHAVTIFLQLLTDFMGTSGDLSCQTYYIMDGVVRRGTTEIKPSCICNKVKAYGDLISLNLAR